MKHGEERDTHRFRLSIDNEIQTLYTPLKTTIFLTVTEFITAGLRDTIGWHVHHCNTDVIQASNPPKFPSL